MNWRKLIPNGIKLKLKLWIRERDMRRLGYRMSQMEPADFPLRITTSQPIFESHLFENKIHNLGLAARKIEQFVIRPGETFSFWTCVGEPSIKNGFKVGRNIVEGEMRESVGGGLCQIAGAIYHTALKAGLEINERHNHTVDYYTEDKRFTPLGADAAVVYGNKDLICTSHLSTAIHFSFEVSINQFIVHLHAEGPILEQTIAFERKEAEKSIAVNGVNQDNTIISSSKYAKPTS